MQGPLLLKLLLAIEPIVVLNAALCKHHLLHCPASEQLLSECRKVRPCMGKPDTPMTLDLAIQTSRRLACLRINVTGLQASFSGKQPYGC